MTNSIKTVKIVTRTVGCNFGTVGVLKSRNGRVVAETDTYPLGHTESARNAAESLAAKLGFAIAK